MLTRWATVRGVLLAALLFVLALLAAEPLYIATMPLKGGLFAPKAKLEKHGRETNEQIAGRAQHQTNLARRTVTFVVSTTTDNKACNNSGPR